MIDRFVSFIEPAGAEPLPSLDVSPNRVGPGMVPYAGSRWRSRPREDNGLALHNCHVMYSPRFPPRRGRVFHHSFRRSSALAVWLLGVVLLPAPPAAAQRIEEVTATPEEAATLFLRSLRAIRWSAAAQFMHPEALERVQQVVDMMVEADSTGEMERYLLGAAGGAGGLTPAEVFARAVGAMIDDMPGLMHAIFDRDDEVLGHVPEGADVAYVVYRTTARISGAVPEIKVMELRRTPRGWRVYWSAELEVLDTALRGVGRGR